MTPRAVLRAAERALARMDLAALTAAALPKRPPPNARVTSIAIGKAAPAMTRGALDRWGDAIATALVVTSDGTDASAVEGRAEVLRSSHPIPDARSVRAAKRCLAVARSAGDGVVVVLVSGGASALACLPAPGISLATKRAVTRDLLASGASIREINVVRKHLSGFKGGALARAAAPCPVLTLVASDIIGGEPSEVGSGPSVADATTVADARRILRRRAPRHAALPLVRTGAVANELRDARIVAAPEQLANAAASELRELGLRVRVLAPSLDDVTKLAEEYARLARSLGTGAAVVRAAEPSVTIPTRVRGRGGRSCHLAALVATTSLLHGDLLDRTAFLALATDGVDGPSGTGGALVDAAFVRRVDRGVLDDAIARFDTGPLHVAAGTAIPRRPTGHNLADLHVLVRLTR